MNFQHVKERISEIARENGTPEPDLIAVSKFQPAEKILELYNLGHRRFGENYVQELTSKAQELPKDIQWHLIGGLQSNKVKVVKEVPNLVSLDSLDSLSKAKKIENQLDRKLDVYVQINVSDEPQKGGLDFKDFNSVLELCKYCLESEKLNLKGLMTIGSLSSVKEHSAKDFDTLRTLRDKVSQNLNVALGLSMGMSADYELAVKHGATCVRVGSLIFGARPVK